MISPLLNCFQGWHGYQIKRDSSRIVNLLPFCAKMWLYINKKQKTSKNHTRNMSYKKHCKIWTSGVSYFWAKVVQCLFLKNGTNFDSRFLIMSKILIVFLIFGNISFNFGKIHTKIWCNVLVLKSSLSIFTKLFDFLMLNLNFSKMYKKISVDVS